MSVFWVVPHFIKKVEARKARQKLETLTKVRHVRHVKNEGK